MIGRSRVAPRTVIEVDTSSYPIYGSDDLALFQVIVDNALDEIRHTWRSEDELELKVRLAAALFKIAEAGERDYRTLKSYTIAAVRSDLRDQNPEASA